MTIFVGALKPNSFKIDISQFKKHVLNSKHIGALVVASSILSGSPNIAFGDARLNAPTAAGTRVNSDPESLLRYGLPIKNDKEIREIQGSIESIKANLKTRRVLFAKNDLSTAKSKLASYRANILKAVPKDHLSAATESIDRLNADITPLEAAINAELESGSGSLQERKGLDDAFAAQNALALELTTLEQLMVPDDFKRKIPEEYASLPALQGRAEVGCHASWAIMRRQ